jgi:hypothetical protein
MDENSTANRDISAEHSLDEQQPHVNNQQCENTTQNQTKAGKVVNVINTVKQSPMTPTPLYIFLFSSQSL